MFEENENICKLCNSYPIDRIENEDSQICVYCREKCIRRPLPKRMVIALITVAISCLISFLKIGDSFTGFIAIKQADREFNKLNYLTAQHRYAQVAEHFPLSEEEAGNYLTSLMMNNNFDKASETFYKYFAGKSIKERVTRESVNEHIQYLLKLFKTRNSVEAKLKGIEDSQAILDKLLSINDLSLDQPYLKYKIASAYIDLGNYKKALPLLREAFNRSVKSYYIAEFLAEALINTGGYNEAKNLCNSILSKNKECVWALDRLSVIKLLENDYDGALQTASKAYLLDGKYPHVAETMAIAYHINGLTGERDKLINGYADESLKQNDELRQLFDGICTLERYFGK